MSSIYITEPNTHGKVLLHTTVGDIDIELWAKETPKACRNFVQLCLEGYYDDVIFHRIIKKFMLQTGDPTGTGQGGKSIYGKNFEDEFHSRIRFNHRGQLAMANDQSPNSNGSQFFITLDSCDWLKNKHTIFGKVTGNTIFNVLRLGDLDTDKDDRPLDPPRIISSEVLMNPFDDIIPREIKKAKSAQETEEDARRRKKKKRKATKNTSLLSFGDEEEESAAAAIAAPTKKVRSVHDTDDPTVAKEVAAEVLQRKAKVAAEESSVEKQAERSAIAEAYESKVNMKAAVSKAAKGAAGPDADDEALSFQEKMRLNMQKKMKKTAADTSEKMKDIMSKREKESSKEILKAKRQEFNDLREEMKKTKRATKVMTGTRAKDYETEEAFREMLTPLEQQRTKYKKNRKSHGNRQQATLEKLKAFQSKVIDTKKNPEKKKEKESYHGQIDDHGTIDGGGSDSDNDEDWASGSLKFKRHIDDMYRKGGRDMHKNDDYVTIDPRDKSKPMLGHQKKRSEYPSVAKGKERERDRGSRSSGSGSSSAKW